MAAKQLKQQIQEDMQNALRAKDKIRLSTLRMLIAAIKLKEIDERIVVDDAQIIAVIDKLIKQRLDAKEQFAAAGRTDLVTKEEAEITILKTYLPKPLSQEEITNIIKTAIKQAGATSVRDIGKVMQIIKPQLQGRADMAKVSTAVKKELT